jgi:hypothetical protein
MEEMIAALCHAARIEPGAAQALQYAAWHRLVWLIGRFVNAKVLTFDECM